MKKYKVKRAGETRLAWWIGKYGSTTRLSIYTESTQLVFGYWYIRLWRW